MSIGDRKLGDQLRRPARYDPEYRRLPADQRLACLATLEDWYEPLPRDIAPAKRIISEIMEVYVRRCMGDPNYFAKVGKAVRRMPPACGSGRTVVLSRSALADHRTVGVRQDHFRSSGSRPVSAQALRHNRICGSCPVCHSSADRPGRGACKRFGEEPLRVDLRVARRDAGHPVCSDATPARPAGTDDRLRDVARICALLGVAAIIIDNVENMSVLRTGGAEMLANFFYELCETCRLLVILVGTYAALPYFSGELRMTRRLSSRGMSHMGAAARDASGSASSRRLWEQQYTRDATPLDREFAAVMWHESAGLPGVAIPLYRLAQERAIASRDSHGQRAHHPQSAWGRSPAIIWHFFRRLWMCCGRARMQATSDCPTWRHCGSAASGFRNRCVRQPEAAAGKPRQRTRRRRCGATAKPAVAVTDEADGVSIRSLAAEGQGGPCGHAGGRPCRY
jgi:hypothetical protein